jgi:hypothetical protein
LRAEEFDASGRWATPPSSTSTRSGMAAPVAGSENKTYSNEPRAEEPRPVEPRPMEPRPVEPKGKTTSNDDFYSLKCYDENLFYRNRRNPGSNDLDNQRK